MEVTPSMRALNARFWFPVTVGGTHVRGASGMTCSGAKPWVLGQLCCCVRPGQVGEVPGPSLLVCLLPEDLLSSTKGAVLAVPGRGGTQKTFSASTEYTKPPKATEATLSPKMMTALKFPGRVFLFVFFYCPSKALKC